MYLFKKEIFTKHNIQFKERINMQDSEILPKLLAHTNCLYFLNKACYNYVQHKSSFTNSNNSAKRLFYFQSIIEVKNSLNQFSTSLNQTNATLKKGIALKIDTLQEVVFNHLLFFNYNRSTIKQIVHESKK